MTSLAQDQSNDIIATDGILSVAQSRDAMAFVIADAVRTLEGELQLDIDAGIPYQRTIWTSASNIAVWKHYVTKRVLALDFVKGITSFDTNLSGQLLTYRLVVETTDGAVTVTN